MVPIPKAIRVRTSSGWQDVALVGPAGPAGGPIDMKRIAGQYENYNGPITSTTLVNLYCDSAGTIPLRLTFTPPVDAWLDATLNMGIVEKSDANYNYGYAVMRLTPPDVDGVQDADHYVMQHASVNIYDHRHVQRVFKLAAGTSYILDGLFTCSAGSWRYHAGKAMLYLDGRLWARGAALDPANRWFNVQNVSAVSSVNFSGLDGVNDLAYELYGQFRWQSVGGDNELLLRFNGDSVGSGRYVWTQAGSYYDVAHVATSNGTNAGTGISILRSNWNNDGYCTIRGIISVPAPAVNVIEYMGQGLFRADQAGPYIGARQHSGQYYAAGANLTSLAVVAPAGNLTGRFALRKLF
jgi:hypothetical protein